MDMVRRVRHLVFAIPSFSLVRVRSKAIEGDTGGTLFNALHRVPKVCSKDRVADALLLSTCFVVMLPAMPGRRVLLLVFWNNVQCSSVFEGTVAFVFSSSGCYLAVMLMWMMAYRRRLVVGVGAKWAEIPLWLNRWSDHGGQRAETEIFTIE